jgi:hypothetical protein
MVDSVKKNMVEVTVIRPYRVRKDICCDDCGLDYSKAHYKVLFEGKKLCYFDVKASKKAKNSPIICHDCFFRHLVDNSKAAKGGKFEIQFKDGNKKQIMEITADLSRLDMSDEELL